MNDLVYQIIGFSGACFILLGFYRTSIGRWKTTALWYELDNFIGAALVIVYQLHFHTYATVLLNAVWAIVALRGLESYAERRQKAKSRKR